MRLISPPGALYVRTRRTYACRIEHPAHLSAQRRHICAAAQRRHICAVFPPVFHRHAREKGRTNPRLHSVSFSQCCRPGMASQTALGKHYADTQALKLDVATRFRQQGRGFCAGKGGGGRQKKYLCNAFKEGCKAEVRAVKQSSGESKVTHLVSEHNECSGSPARASSAALAALGNAALGSNPTMKTTDAKRSLEQEGARVAFSFIRLAAE